MPKTLPLIVSPRFVFNYIAISLRRKYLTRYFRIHFVIRYSVMSILIYDLIRRLT